MPKQHLHPWLCTLAKNFDCWLALLVGFFAQLGGKLSNEIFWLLRAKIQPCFVKPFWWTIIGPCFVKPSKRPIMVKGWAQHCFVKPIQRCLLMNKWPLTMQDKWLLVMFWLRSLPKKIQACSEPFMNIEQLPSPVLSLLNMWPRIVWKRESSLKACFVQWNKKPRITGLFKKGVFLKSLQAWRWPFAA